MSFPEEFNKRVLVSDAKHIASKGLNAHEHTTDQPDVESSIREHSALLAAFQQAGVKIEQVPTPAGMQDAIFTANWGLTWNGRALMSRLPNLRQPEEPYANEALRHLGFEMRQASVLFSGQGDALIIGGNRVLIGSGYRTNPKVADEIREWLGLEPIVVRAKPQRRWYGAPVRNKVTGLWDSYFYDLDIAVGVIRPDLIAVCWEALTSEGKAAIRGLKDVEIIPVDYHEAKDALACNLVSIGKTVIMADNAPLLSAELEKRGLNLIKLPNHELRKGGGGFRCSSLSLYK